MKHVGDHKDLGRDWGSDWDWNSALIQSKRMRSWTDTNHCTSIIIISYLSFLVVLVLTI